MSSNVMHVAKTGLNAQQLRIQVISNNLANVNTMGFKRDRPNFESLLYQTQRPAGAQTSEATQAVAPTNLGTGVRLVSTDKIHTQGALQTTGNALDLAIQGDGFFQVLLPDGQIGYTRNGIFSQNAEGIVTTMSGYVLQPEIQVPDGATSVTVSRDGIVSATVSGDVDPQEIGQVTLAQFVNPRGLDPLGENFLGQTGASGAPIVSPPLQDGAGDLMQGALEISNVNVVQELVEMIEAQRAYEINSRSISASDEMMSYLTNQL
ncbi:MAG: flagellar basal-body rod protein FlgG [Rhodobacteraceae bacterium]|nr:flagellar basal-body rod protein FlgG [Paracoccaceae bacterium]